MMKKGKGIIALMTSFLMVFGAVIPSYAVVELTEPLILNKDNLTNMVFYNSSSESDSKTYSSEVSYSRNYYTYAYTAEKDGYISCSFDANNGTSNSTSYSYYRTYKDYTKTLSVYRVENGKLVKLADYTTSGTLETPKIAVSANAKVYFVVSAEIPYTSYEYSYYKVKFNRTYVTGWEKELNNSQATANAISVGSGINGNLYSSGDSDWYSFSTGGTGYVSVTTSSSASNVNRGWNVSLHGADGSTIGDYGNLTNSTSAGIPVAAGTYYVEVKDPGDGSSVGADYNLTVNYADASASEVEPNNDLSHANAIGFYSTVHGSLLNGSDGDYYAFSIASRTNVVVNLSVSANQSGAVNSGWGVYLKNASDGNITGFTTTSASSASAILNAGTYYVFVASVSGSSAPAGVMYDLTLGTASLPVTTVVTKPKKLVVGKVRGFALTPAKRRMRVRIKGNVPKNAKKFQVGYRSRKLVTKTKKVKKTVRVKTNKKDAKGKPIYVKKTKWVKKKYKTWVWTSKWKYKTTKNTNKVIIINSLKRRTNYLFKVRALNGKTYGAWSAELDNRTK